MADRASAPAAPANTPPAAAQLWRSRLWRKHAAVLVVLCVCAIGSFGGVEMMATYADAKTQAGRLQNAQANEAAFAIRATLAQIVRQVEALNALPWQPGWLGLDVRREEFARLLRLAPMVESISWRDGAGTEMLRVSRREADQVRRDLQPAAPRPAASGAEPALVAYSGVAYTESADAVIDITVRDSDARSAGSTRVRVGLRALARELRQALSMPGAEIYAVDAAGLVALHRDPSVLLARKPAPFALPASAAAVAPGASGGDALYGVTPGPAVELGRGLRLGEVARSRVALSELGWQLVVERPRSEVMAPVWATVQRTAAFLTAGVLVSMSAALWLAGRLTLPVRQLHRAAATVAAGRLDTAIQVRTGDELEDLAAQFNRMAASLQASYSDLEDKVTARTLDLQRATRHKSDFLANMSHELRTPLNAILGFADVLREGMAGPLNAEQNEYLADIHASGLHLLSLINDVLDLSKIEAGQLALEPREFSVPETVASAVALVRQRALHKQLALQVDIAPALGLWRADERRFKQVLLNLLGNAVKFTPEGGRVAVQAGLSDDPAEGLWVSVQDNGIGIAAADHEAVFQEFRQVGADSAGRAEGTGLGLALARRLVEQHGGRITLRSELGAGACFRFHIPARAT
jgi:signal transduction histidine kinase